MEKFAQRQKNLILDRHIGTMGVPVFHLTALLFSYLDRNARNNFLNFAIGYVQIIFFRLLLKNLNAKNTFKKGSHKTFSKI